MSAESRAESRYDSRKYRLAHRALWILTVAFYACLWLLWRQGQVALVPGLFTGLGTGLLSILGSYGLSNAAAKYAGGSGGGAP